MTVTIIKLAFVIVKFLQNYFVTLQTLQSF